MLDIETLATQAAEHARATGKRMPDCVDAVLLRFSLTEAQFAKYRAAILSECGRRGGQKNARQIRKKPKKGEPYQMELLPK